MICGWVEFVLFQGFSVTCSMSKLGWVNKGVSGTMAKFQGLSGAVKTVRIIKELIEIWPDEVCDRRGLLSFSC